MIRFEKVSRRLGGKPVLDAVDLEIRKGETFVIVGSSGAGKSVTLKHMVRFLTPDSGQVRVDGRAVDGTHARHRPVFKPLFDTRSEEEILLALMGESVSLEAYLAAPRRTSGPLFVGPRSPRLTVKEVDRAVKRAVTAAGFDAKLYSAHSLRAGYVTDARRAGKTWAEIMEHTRHADLRVAKGYARYERDPFAKCVDGR